MIPPLTHVAGIPLEEGLLTLTPVASVLALAVTARLRTLRGWRVRRSPTTSSVPKEHT